MKQQGISLAGRLNRTQDPARDEVGVARNAGYGVQRLGIASVEVTEPESPFRMDVVASPMAEVTAFSVQAAQVAGLATEPVPFEYVNETSLVDLARTAAGRAWRIAEKKLGGRKRLAMAGGGFVIVLIGLVWLLCRGGDGPMRPQMARGGVYASSPSARVGDTARSAAQAAVARAKKNGAEADFESTRTARAALLYGKEGQNEQEWVIQPRMARGSESSGVQSSSGRETMTEQEFIPSESSDTQHQAKPTTEKRYRSCPPGMVLSGVVRCPEGLLANISGRFVPVGGTVNDAVVIEIKDYSVEMEIAGERFLLGINAPAPPPVKETVAEDDAKTDKGQADQQPVQDPQTQKSSGSNKSESNSGKKSSAAKSDR